MRQPSNKNIHSSGYRRGPDSGVNLAALGVGAGFLLSAMAFLAGTFCAIDAFVTGDHGMNAAATALLIAMIPLLLLAGFCLDRMERLRKRSAATSTETEPRKPKLLLVQPAKAGGNTSMVQRGTILVVVLFGFLVLAGRPANAQQTIFNVPTTDVLPKGKVYFELDAPFKPNNDPNNLVTRFSSFVPRIVIGAGGNFEVGLNVTGNIQSGADSTTLVPSIKFKAYDGGDNGWAIAAGDNLSIPVRNKGYNVGNYVYLEASKTFKTKTRLTFGGYHFSGNVVAPNAQRAGGQFGFEQTVNSKFSVVADWFTGKHAAGYFTPGITFKPYPKVTGYFGYSIGNTGASRGNHYFLAEIGINFN